MTARTQKGKACQEQAEEKKDTSFGKNNFKNGHGASFIFCVRQGEDGRLHFFHTSFFYGFIIVKQTKEKFYQIMEGEK